MRSCRNVARSSQAHRQGVPGRLSERDQPPVQGSALSDCCFAKAAVGLSRESAYFQGPNHPVGIGPGLPLAVFRVLDVRVLPAEGQAPQRHGCHSAPLVSRVGRDVVQSVLNSLDVQSAATYHNGHRGTPFVHSALVKERLRAKRTASCAKRPALYGCSDPDEVHEMVGRHGPLFCGRLGCTDGDVRDRIVGYRRR